MIEKRDMTVTLRFPTASLPVIREGAKRRGMTEKKLLEQIVLVINRDNLLDAVLDD